MLHFTTRVLAIGMIIGGLSAALAVSPAIGTATADGSFLVDRSMVRGNATLFPGTVVETRTDSSLLRMGDGTKLRLGALSRGQVFPGRLVLEKGESLIEKSSRYSVEAAGLRIVPATGKVAARIALDESRVSVAVASGDLRVVNAEGTLLAKIHGGDSLVFDQEASGAAPPFTVTGCLVYVKGAYFLTDETTDVRFELIGAGLAANNGSRVEISGTEVISKQTGGSAPKVIRVLQLKLLTGSCSTPLAAAGKKSGKGNAAGMSTAAKATIAGVAIAGGVVGTAVGLIDEPQADAVKPPISR